MDKRFTAPQLSIWKQEGAVLLPAFFTPDEIDPVCRDFDLMYAGRSPQSPNHQREIKPARRTIGEFNFDQFKNIDDLPFDCSPALNMLALPGSDCLGTRSTGDRRRASISGA